MPRQYLVSPGHRVASDDGPGVGGISAGQGGLPGHRFQFHARILERVRQLCGQGVGYQFGPVGQHLVRRRVIPGQQVRPDRHPDQAGRALRPVRSHQHHLADQVNPGLIPHDLRQLHRINGQAADIGSAQGILHMFQPRGGQHQGIVPQGFFHGQHGHLVRIRGVAGAVRQDDAQRHLVAPHQGHVSQRHLARRRQGQRVSIYVYNHDWKDGRGKAEPPQPDGSWMGAGLIRRQLGQRQARERSQGGILDG